MSSRLGVNIDHVATLREARGEDYPCLKRATKVCLENGADQITIHLREDRRHIQDNDVFDVRKIVTEYNKLLNLEISTSDSVIDTCLEAKPDWVCLVPEKREERTTEGGLNLLSPVVFEKIESTINLLKDKLDVKISLFVEANTEVLGKVSTLNIDAVEIHTGDFALAYNKGLELSPFYKQFENSKKKMNALSLGHHAGHGLTLEMLDSLVSHCEFEEYNIGHWIIAESIFSGLGHVVESIRKKIK